MHSDSLGRMKNSKQQQTLQYGAIQSRLSHDLLQKPSFDTPFDQKYVEKIISREFSDKQKTFITPTTTNYVYRTSRSGLTKEFTSFQCSKPIVYPDTNQQLSRNNATQYVKNKNNYEIQLNKHNAENYILNKHHFPVQLNSFEYLKQVDIPIHTQQLSRDDCNKCINKYTLANGKRIDQKPSEIPEYKDAEYCPVNLRPPDCLKKRYIARKWKCMKKIGRGSFGETYLAKHRITGEFVAVKIESIHSGHHRLLHEAKILQSLQHQVGFPRVYYCGAHKDQYAVMVMELLYSSLEEVFVRWANRCFSETLTAMIGLQIIDRVEALHSSGYLHRDIKPENFLVGPLNVFDKVYMIDFGLSKRYYDTKTGKHIPYSDQRTLTGTARYVSLNVHMGIEPSRRDDLESCAYLMIYFLKGGRLPWQGLKAVNKQDKYTKILNKKLTTNLDTLTEDLPRELYGFVKYCRSLEFDSVPDYNYLRQLLTCIIMKNRAISSNSYLVDSIYTEKNYLNSKIETTRDRETTTTSATQHNTINISNGSKVSYNVTYMLRFQNGLKRIYCERYNTDASLNSAEYLNLSKEQQEELFSKKKYSDNKSRLLHFNNKTITGSPVAQYPETSTQFKKKKQTCRSKQHFFCIEFNNEELE